MSKINRRNFLKTLGASSLLFSQMSTFPLNVLAQGFSENRNKTNFVLFRVIGGMDSLLGLHPWLDFSKLPEEELFLTYYPHEVLRKVSGTQIDLGVSALQLQDFVRDMIVIRGVVMGASDLGHPASIQHISAGKTVDTAPHVSSMISQALNGDEKFFITNSVVQKHPRHTYSTILTNSLNGVNFNDLPADTFGSLFSIYKRQDDSLSNFLRFLSQKGKLGLFQKIVEEAQAQNQAAFVVSDDYNQVTNTGATINPENFVLASLASEFSQVAQIDLVDESRNLDTHGTHIMHKEYQKVRWDRIAAFMSNLKRYNLWDNTVVMVVSEFNRSPGKNSTDGKDHNTNDNAIALFGGALNGGRVYGDHQLHLSQATRTASLWTGSYLNFKSGAIENISTLSAAREKTTDVQSELPKHINLIRPENVWASILNHFDPSAVSQFGDEINLIPGLFRNG